MEILRALEQRGVKCWTAPRDVPPGGSYAEAILTAIENASCFVLVYTEHSNVSPHVLREVERALSLGINIMPVRFDASNISKSLDYLLATVHWLSVIGEPRSASIDQAAERIAACVVEKEESPGPLREAPPPAMPAAPPPLPPAPAQTQPVGSGGLLLWIGLIVIAIAGVLFAVQTVRRAIPKQQAAVASATPSPVITATPEAASTAVAAAQFPSAPPVLPPPPVVAESPVETPPAVAEESPEATETDSAAAPPPRTLSRATPLQVVRQYFTYLADRNTIKAYELLSTDYRSRETFVTYTRNYASTDSLRLVSAREASVRAEAATVTVTFDKKNRKFGWIRWQGPVQLKAEPAGWRIDNFRGLKASSVRR